MLEVYKYTISQYIETYIHVSHNIEIRHVGFDRKNIWSETVTAFRYLADTLLSSNTAYALASIFGRHCASGL